MHIHILGICGTFMGSLAVLAKESGLTVTGCDEGVYPPMSTQLERQGIELHEGFDIQQLALGADLFVIGNAISRGNPLLEEILNRGLPYTSGPQMLADHVLPGKWVLAAAGTHGKTTTSTMLAWILDFAGMDPGFLIGGVPHNFECSARLGSTPFFVIEADEYDSAFFDKRSKFVHYRPRTFIFNNLEYDHADIFPDLAAIQTQFHHVIRTIPQNGRVIFPQAVPAIDEVLAKGCWTETEGFTESSDPDFASEAPGFRKLEADGGAFEICHGQQRAEVRWELTGDHNVNNGVAAMLAARHVGVTFDVSAKALSCFEGVKRRMERLADLDGIRIYDDFAHHPTAIKSTLAGLRASVGDERIVALIEPRSNTMRMGIHEHTLLESAEQADQVIWADLSGMDWLREQVAERGSPHCYGSSVEQLLAMTCEAVQGPAHVVVMSNGGFAGIHQRLIAALGNLGGVA